MIRRTRHRLWVLPAAVAVACFALSPDALAQSEARLKDQPEEGQGSESVSAKDKDPLRGSTFLFDQSMSTQTAGLENAEQSNVPFYGWWLSLRPRWSFDEHWRVQARLDYYKELTNSQDTTYYREDVFGDIWTELVYSTPLADRGRLEEHEGERRAPRPVAHLEGEPGERDVRDAGRDGRHQPEDPHQRRGGQGAQLGARRPQRRISPPLHAVDDRGLVRQLRRPAHREHHRLGRQRGGRLRAPFRPDHRPDAARAPALHHPRHRSADHAQARGHARLHPHQQLALRADAGASACVSTPTGPVCPGQTGVTSGPDQQFTQLAWIIASADYEIIPELSVGLGYYNLSNVIATDGTLRSPFAGGFDNVFWSPDARVFLDVTANLDKIFEDASGKYKTVAAGQTAQAAQAARQSAVVNGLR